MSLAWLSSSCTLTQPSQGATPVVMVIKSVDETLGMVAVELCTPVKRGIDLWLL